MQWSDIERADGNHHCSRCEKNIVDLTTKSDKELIQFFKNKSDNICGRLLDSQLNRELVLPSSRLNWHWLVPFALSAFIVSPAHAQNLKPAPVHSDQHPKSSSAAVELSNTLPPLDAIITGKGSESCKWQSLKCCRDQEKGR
jgi:hypothetical protein